MSQKKPTFEENMQRLEQIVRAMERGEVPLEESLKLFQEGTELVRTCGKLLDEAQLQVNKIAVSEDGSPVEEPFDAEL
ncbi:MAG: exodeoxyribonuclease VII small subunit [Oscillospiraceae bacterium]|nr:exodeoxyribonuclease VII small subunit [Oscillospiraceae bacterium]